MTSRTYPSPVAMWRASVDTARAVGRATGRRNTAVLREYLYGRVLDRVFADPDSPWVLKGGTALLVRATGARHSKDVDLLHRHGTLEDAVVQLRTALALDRGDQLGFQVTRIDTVGAGQQDVDGTRVWIEAYAGTKKVDAFHIDLVVGSLMTVEPDEREAPSAINVLGLTVPTVRLYPVVDHVADKVCATEATYTSGLPSSRARDLVDLVVIARTESVSLRALRAAIASERHHRGLPPRADFDPPDGWDSRYPTLAKETAHCADLPFQDAVRLVKDFLGPALVPTDSSPTRTWAPGAAGWVPA